MHAVTYLAAAPTYELDGVTVHGMRERYEADVVITHLGDNGRAAARAAEEGTPQVRMVHGWSQWSRKRLEENPPTVAVFNSHSLQRRIGWPGEVVHPPVWPDRFVTEPGDRVTQVNLSKEKGGDLFWLLARVVPEWRFLGVRGGYGSQIVKSGAEVIKTTEDMRSVYARTRILICPSQEESWGMAALEAMSSGIPVIATPTDGFRESLGDAGIFVDRTNVKGWVGAIRRLADHSEWDKASRKARNRVSQLDPAGEVVKFTKIVEGLCA